MKVAETNPTLQLVYVDFFFPNFLVFSHNSLPYAA